MKDMKYIIAAALLLAFFAVLIIGFFKYLKQCEIHRYSPFNLHILSALLSALLPLSLIGWRAADAAGNARYFFICLCAAGSLVGIVSMILNLRKAYQRLGSLFYAFINFIVQCVISYFTLFTCGLFVLITHPAAELAADGGGDNGNARK